MAPSKPCEKESSSEQASAQNVGDNMPSVSASNKSKASPPQSSTSEDIENDDKALLLKKETSGSINIENESESDNEVMDQVDQLPPKIKPIDTVNLKKEPPALKVNLDEKDLKVKIIFQQSKDQSLVFSLAELRKLFYKKRDRCKLDWHFVFWDIKIKKYTKMQQEEKVTLAMYNQIKNFVDSLKIVFDTSKETFEIVKKCFVQSTYPFKLQPQRKKEFDAFMKKYVIDESFMDQGIQLYSMDQIFCQKRPNLSKYECKTGRTNKRINRTCDMLGPLHEMKDKVGHKFSSIFLNYMKNEEGIQIFQMTPE